MARVARVSAQELGVDIEGMTNIEEVDPEIAASLRGEIERQRFGLELIPSENFVLLVSFQLRC